LVIKINYYNYNLKIFLLKNTKYLQKKEKEKRKKRKAKKKAKKKKLQK
jgi:hypothetical protein